MTSIHRVLITGGTGFVGRWMQRTCPDNVMYMAIGRDAYDAGVMDWAQNLTHVVHLAPIHPDQVVKLAQKHGARLLYCSSGIVYYPEQDTRYRHEKVEGEKYVKNSGLDAVIARLFTFFGDGLDENKAITQFFRAVREKRPIPLYSDVPVVRSYMHGAEMGRQMWRILLEGQSGRAYDVGSIHKTTLERLAQRISAFTGATIERIHGRIPVPEYYPTPGNRIVD